MLIRSMSRRSHLCVVLAALSLIAAAPSTRPAAVPDGMVLIPGGTFQMGTDNGFPYEGPSHEVTVRPFYMDRTEVTVAAFRAFVTATGYKTDAEKFGWSGVFDPKIPGWTKCDGADWRHPTGPKSTARDNDPVVHVSFADATAYAAWARKRLPTEAEFEFALRGGLDHKVFPWGDELTPGGRHLANTWQGNFPDRDTAADGFDTIAPVASFPPNPYGLYDIAGNVWEWTADYFAADYYAHSPKDNPTGPDKGDEKVIRGGSWLCASNYCAGYRAAARQHTAPDSGLNNLGFRCVRDR